MAFDINNLPTGWSAGRSGGRKVFYTDKGEKLSEAEANDYFQVDSFQGFGTDQQDKDSLSVSRPTGSTDISMMNGGSDGAGNPDPVNVNPLGSTYNQKYDDQYDRSKDRFAETDDYQRVGHADSTQNLGPVATVTGEILDAGTLPPKDPVKPEITEVDAEAKAAEAAAEAAAAEQARLDAIAEAEALKQAEKDAATIAAAEQRAVDAEQAAADALAAAEEAKAEFEKFKLDYEAELEARADKRVKTYESALDMLGKGDFGSVIEDYQKRISGEGDIDGGRPEQPTAELIKIGSDGLPELRESTVDVSWGTDRRNNTGWGYYGIDPIFPGITFIITQETAAAGEDYVRDNAQIDQMEAFIERMAAAESDDARQQIMNQEIALLNEEIADAARLKSQRNAETNIDLQADRNLEAQDAAQEFSRQERRYSQNFTKAQNKLGREFTQEERLAVQAYQDTVREQERDLNREDTEAAQQFSSRQQEDTQRFAEKQQEDTQSFQEESRIAGQEFSTSERRDSQQFISDQASTANERAIQDREDRQANETLQRQQAQQFNLQRDQIEFDRQSRLESVRLGIADATSEEGIARAVELANEARQLERSSAMLDVVERIASSGLGRQMADSGLLEQLSAEFGVDLSFLITGGLGTGSSGNAPVRVTA